MPIVLKSGNLNLLEPSGPVQACNGIALPLPLPLVGGKRPFGNPGEKWRRVHMLKEETARMSTNSYNAGQSRVAGSCESGDEHVGST